MTEGIERRLVAIVSVDVAGYSRLIAQDEVTTVRTLASYRSITSDLVAQHRGRVVDNPGDNALLEFPSATDAVECAIDIQKSITERNSDVPADRRMEFRIGVHLGEVLVEDARIYGDGVNVAARLEAMAPVGGIVISKTVHDQIANKIDVAFTDLGEQELKNITQPVHAFRVETGTPRNVILAASVADLDALLKSDEEGTLASLKAHRLATDPVVYSHGGSVVGEYRGGLLYQFPSALEAVKGAAEAQALMAQRFAMLQEDRRMQYRLGIHLVHISGAAEETPDTLVASQIRDLSEPGGICISNEVHSAVQGELHLEFFPAGSVRADSGEEIAVWRLASDRAATGESLSSGPGAVVVLPFERLGNDPDQDYLVDGITEDVTTALTSYGEFRVVPRGSAFTYRGVSKSDREIARELDATYVLRGSVRATTDRVRVSVQLTDADADQAIWAERFDRDLEDVFDLQDEIARSITLRLVPELFRSELDRSMARGTGNLESWDLYQRGRWHYYRTTPSDYVKSIALLEQAIDRDPNNGRAMSFLGFVFTIRIWRGWSPDVPGDYKRAIDIGERAVRSDNANWRAHAALSVAYAFTGQHDRAMKDAELSLPWWPAAVGIASWLAGDLKTAAEYLTRAIRESPGDKDNYHWRTGLGYVHYMDGNYPAALAWGEEGLQGLPDYLQTKALLAATLARLGRDDEAHRYMAEFMMQLPGTTAARYRKTFKFKNQAHVDAYMEGLIKAGMPRE
ncbi:MAG: adenylate/guanylate cyclase domain-containing protein [Actinomycetota bacterium]|nr:adenylate/guanylate cyclase domain-containing protein [Actinomycetota bacterium]